MNPYPIDSVRHATYERIRTLQVPIEDDLLYTIIDEMTVVIGDRDAEVEAEVRADVEDEMHKSFDKVMEKTIGEIDKLREVIDNLRDQGLVES